jgi:hypothetical protein
MLDDTVRAHRATSSTIERGIGVHNKCSLIDSYGDGGWERVLRDAFNSFGKKIAALFKRAVITDGACVCCCNPLLGCREQESEITEQLEDRAEGTMKAKN